VGSERAEKPDDVVRRRPADQKGVEAVGVGIGKQMVVFVVARDE